jgi:hypothetical protein
VDYINAVAMCENSKCKIITYEEGVSAMLLLPSSESIIVSWGGASIKVLEKRFILGWIFPRIVLSYNVLKNGDVWLNSIPLTKRLIGDLVFDTTLKLVVECNSVSEIKLKYFSVYGGLIEKSMAEFLGTT